MSGVATNEFVEAARTRLPAELADRWIPLLRAGFRLRPAELGEPVVCRLGGDPRLPEATPWPEWPGHGPLTFIAEVDCAALPDAELHPPLPAEGTLLFFYSDGQLDCRASLVLGMDDESQRGARVLYVGPGLDVAERSAPDGIKPYRRQDLAGDAVISAPSFEHPAAVWTIIEPDAAEIFTSGFADVVRALDHGPGHQIAGHAYPVQGAVEPGLVAPAAAGLGESADAANAAAHEWLLLAQFTSDGHSHMMWGDFGILYWLIKADDLAARQFDRARMTWQCH